MKACYINSIASIHSNGIVSDDDLLHACEPDYKEIITNANQRRRMSHLVKMGVACGLDCLQQSNTQQIDAIITATGLGCLADTEKFLNVLIDNKEELLNPTAFIQSTFNTIGAQIALLSNNHAYNNTYVHRGLSFESALLDAMMRINEGDNNVLVGATDEATTTAQIIMQRLGLLRGITMGEGAQFLVLSADADSNTYCKLESIQTSIGKLTTEEVEKKIGSFLSNHDLSSSDISIFMSGDNGHEKQDDIYKYLQATMFSGSQHQTFKKTSGEYHTASSYAVFKAANILKENTLGHCSNILIYNHYNAINHSLILLRKL